MRLIAWFLCCYSILMLATASAQQFSSDVPLLQQEQLKRQFWQTKLAAGDRLILNTDEIAKRNTVTFNQQAELFDLSSLPAAYSKAALLQIIDSVSSKPSSSRFYADGTELTAQVWQQYQQLLARDKVTAHNPLQFGMVLRRTALRAFPTSDRVFNAEGNTDLDRFAETALFPTDAIAILHQSRDQQWALVRSFNYTGWVKQADIAIGDKKQVLAYAAKAPFLVVTGATVTTAYTPELPALSQLQLDMGLRLPLLSAAQTGVMVNGQNSAASYIVELPVRGENGQLAFRAALIPLSADVHQGYLPFTENNVLAQAFKFLGERYGWGHDYNGRDCTGFISEVFRSFGFVMPRNSGQQGKGSYGTNQRFSEADKAAKFAALARMQVGDLLYFPGHVSMYLGQVDGQPFMIHDVNTLIYQKPNGDLYRGKLNGVVVTPLLPLNANAEQSYLDALYAIKSLR